MAVEWRVETSPIKYDDAAANTELRHMEVRRGESPEQVRVMEMPHVYTVNPARSSPQDPRPRVPKFMDVPIAYTDRGGTWAYHGPGQKAVVINLRIEPDIEGFMARLGDWVLGTMADLGVQSPRLEKDDRFGVWVDRPEKGEGYQDKLISVGIRLTGGVSAYGFTVNVSPDLSYYDGIVACSVQDARYGMTSLKELGLEITDEQFNSALRSNFERVFGETVDSP